MCGGIVMCGVVGVWLWHFVGGCAGVFELFTSVVCVSVHVVVCVCESAGWCVRVCERLCVCVCCVRCVRVLDGVCESVCWLGCVRVLDGV